MAWPSQAAPPDHRRGEAAALSVRATCQLPPLVPGQAGGGLVCRLVTLASRTRRDIDAVVFMPMGRTLASTYLLVLTVLQCRPKLHDDPMSKTKWRQPNRRQIALPESSKQKGELQNWSRHGFHCGARSLTRCWFFQQIHWNSEEQLRRLLKKKSVPAQLRPRRRRTVLDPSAVIACRCRGGEGRSCTRWVEPIHQPKPPLTLASILMCPVPQLEQKLLPL